MLFKCFCILHNRSGIIILADMLYLYLGLSADDKAAGIQGIVHMLDDDIRFSCNQGFVNLQTSLNNHSVGAYLRAGGKA